jgi:maleylpyruvate isomerase
MVGVQPVERVLQQLADATAGLIAGLDGLTDGDARGLSRLPGWTRGHVLTHLARNAEGGARLLGWARTGIPGYEYRSVAARAAAIEEGAGRPPAALAADVGTTAAAFAVAAAAVPPDAWQSLVTWTTGQQTRAELIASSRLAEVLIHHVDLDVGFGPGSWPADFVGEMLGVVVSTVNQRVLAPLTARLTAADTSRTFQIGGEAARAAEITGTEVELLAWLLGRSDGACLIRDDPDPLPPVPSIYFT